MESDFMESAAGVDLRSGNGICVDDELDGNLPALADSGPLDVPVGLLVERALANYLRLGGWLGIKQGSDPGADFDGRRRRELQLATSLAHAAVAHAEIDQVAAAVPDVGPAFLDALAPAVEIEPAVVELDVDSPQADALAVNAGEIGLAADPRAKAAVQGVIPDVEQPGNRRVHRGQEIDRVMHHVHDVFIGADAVEGRNLVRRNRVGRGLQSPTRVGEPDKPALRLGPLQLLRKSGDSGASALTGLARS